MNALPPDTLIVSNIAGPLAVLSISTPSASTLATVAALGFQQDGERWTKHIASEAERLALIHQLIAANALFSDGPGWSPAQLLALWKEQGRLSHTYSAIAWTGPQTYRITEA